MRRDINKAFFSGELQEDPRLAYTSSNKPVCNLRLLNIEEWESNGESKSMRLYLNATIWGAVGEDAGKRLKKGMSVMLFGKLSWHGWEDKQGNKKSEHQINADSWQLLAEAPEMEPAETQADPVKKEEDDLPF